MRTRTSVLGLLVAAGLLLFTLALLTAETERPAAADVLAAPNTVPAASALQSPVNIIPETDPARFVPGHLLVKFRPGIELLVSSGKVQPNDSELASVLEQVRVISAQRVFPDFTPQGERSQTSLASTGVTLRQVYLLTIDSNVDILEAAARLSTNPRVIYAEPDYIAQAAEEPVTATTSSPVNDPLYSEQWGVRKVRTEEAWGLQKGNNLFSIAVIDSGLDLNHPDLLTKLWTNSGEVVGNGVDDDGNGYVDDAHGWDFLDDDAGPQDDSGHGTHIAGIAAAATDNAVGVAGIDQRAQIIPLKVLDAGGSGSYSDVAAAIYYAANKGADVINLSLGAYSPSQTLRDALAYAAQTAVIVAAAGNDGREASFYPAAYDDYVLAVAATTSSDLKASFSNYGGWVDLCAPGVDVYSTYWDDTYAIASGSSVAAPFAAGAAALVKAQHPDWSPATIRLQLKNTTHSIDALNPSYAGKLGSGLLDIYAALSTAGGPRLVVGSKTIVDSGDRDGIADAGETISLTVQLRNEWHSATAVHGVLSTTDPYVTMVTSAADYGDIASGEMVGNATPYVFQIAGPGSLPAGHVITFTLEVTADGGYSNNLTLVVASQLNNTFHGIISSDTTWHAHSVYYLDGNVLVAEGVTLTIEPDVTVIFGRIDMDANGQGERYLRVQGTLIAAGEPGQEIAFKGDSGTPLSGGDWLSIQFKSTAQTARYDAIGSYIGGSRLSYCRFLDSVKGLELSDGAAPYLDHVEITRNHQAVPGTGVELVSDGGSLTDFSLTGTMRFTIREGQVGNLALGGTAYVTATNATLAGVTFSGDGSLVAENTTGGALVLGAAQLEASGGAFSSVSTGGGDARLENTGVGGDVSASGLITLVQVSVQGNLSSSGALQATYSAITGTVSVNGGTATILTTTVAGSLSVTGAAATVQFAQVKGVIAGPGSNLHLSRSLVEGASGDGVSINSPASFYMSQTSVSHSGGSAIRVNSGASAIVAIADCALVDNAGDGISFVTGGTGFSLTGSNVVRNSSLAFRNQVGASVLPSFSTSGNWWGTADSLAIDASIWDGNDDFDLGIVAYQPMLDHPSETAPAYLVSGTTTPPSPVGMEDITLDLTFSKPMFPPGQAPAQANLRLYAPAEEDWRVFDKNNSPVGRNNEMVTALAIDSTGRVWVGTDQGTTFGNSGVYVFNGTDWTIYTKQNSGMRWVTEQDIAFDLTGNVWIAGLDCTISSCSARGVLKFDGTTWQLHNLISYDPSMQANGIDVDSQNRIWVATSAGLFRYASGSWTQLNPPHDPAQPKGFNDVDVDDSDIMWLGASETPQSLYSYNGATWQLHPSPANLQAVVVDKQRRIWAAGQIPGSGWRFGFLDADENAWTTLADYGWTDGIRDIALDARGQVWIAAWKGLKMWNGAEWTLFDTAHSEAPADDSFAVSVDSSGQVWCGYESKLARLRYIPPRNETLSVGNWQDSSHYSAPYSLDAYFPRGVFTVTVSGIVGADGIPMPSAVFTATADYITGATLNPPPAPTVSDDGTSTQYTDRLHATWVPAGGTIVEYMYAIGTAPEKTDVINWTSAGTSTSITHTGLSLQPGRAYYFGVKARNEGRIWSEAGWSNGITVSPPTVNFSLSLQPGWNLVSVPFIPTDSRPDAVLASVTGKYDRVYGYESGIGWRLRDVINPLGNTLSSMGERGGYWVHMTQVATLSASGWRPSSTSIPLVEGWNLVGYPASASRAIATVLAPITGKYTLVYVYDSSDTSHPWKKYDPSAPPYANTLTTMQRGRGYWIKATEACNWVVPY